MVVPESSTCKRNNFTISKHDDFITHAHNLSCSERESFRSSERNVQEKQNLVCTNKRCFCCCRCSHRAMHDHCQHSHDHRYRMRNEIIHQSEKKSDGYDSEGVSRSIQFPHRRHHAVSMGSSVHRGISSTINCDVSPAPCYRSLSLSPSVFVATGSSGNNSITSNSSFGAINSRRCQINVGHYAPHMQKRKDWSNSPLSNTRLSVQSIDIEKKRPKGVLCTYCSAQLCPVSHLCREGRCVLEPKHSRSSNTAKHYPYQKHYERCQSELMQRFSSMPCINANNNNDIGWPSNVTSITTRSVILKENSVGSARSSSVFKREGQKVRSSPVIKEVGSMLERATRTLFSSERANMAFLDDDGKIRLVVHEDSIDTIKNTNSTHSNQTNGQTSNCTSSVNLMDQCRTSIFTSTNHHQHHQPLKTKMPTPIEHESCVALEEHNADNSNLKNTNNSMINITLPDHVAIMKLGSAKLIKDLETGCYYNIKDALEKSILDPKGKCIMCKGYENVYLNDVKSNLRKTIANLLSETSGFAKKPAGRPTSFLEMVHSGVLDLQRGMFKNYATGQDMSTIDAYLAGLVNDDGLRIMNGLIEEIVSKKGANNDERTLDVHDIEDSKTNQLLTRKEIDSLSLSDAIELKLINYKSNCFIRASDGQRFSIKQALDLDLLSMDVPEIILPEYKSRMTVRQAICEGIIDMDSCSLIVGKEKLSFALAAEQGLIRKPKTLGELFLHGYVDYSRYPQFIFSETKKQWVTFESLLSYGDVDTAELCITDQSTSKIISLNEAMKKGMVMSNGNICLGQIDNMMNAIKSGQITLVVSRPELKEPLVFDEKNTRFTCLREAVRSRIINLIDHTFLNSVTKEVQPLSKAIDDGLVSRSLYSKLDGTLYMWLLDIGSMERISILEAFKSGILDLGGSRVRGKDGRWMGIENAVSNGLLDKRSVNMLKDVLGGVKFSKYLVTYNEMSDGVMQVNGLSESTKSKFGMKRYTREDDGSNIDCSRVKRVEDSVEGDMYEEEESVVRKFHRTSHHHRHQEYYLDDEKGCGAEGMVSWRRCKKPDRVGPYLLYNSSMRTSESSGNGVNNGFLGVQRMASSVADGGVGIDGEASRKDSVRRFEKESLSSAENDRGNRAAKEIPTSFSGTNTNVTSSSSGGGSSTRNATTVVESSDTQIFDNNEYGGKMRRSRKSDDAAHDSAIFRSFPRDSVNGTANSSDTALISTSNKSTTSYTALTRRDEQRRQRLQQQPLSFIDAVNEQLLNINTGCVNIPITVADGAVGKKTLPDSSSSSNSSSNNNNNSSSSRRRRRSGSISGSSGCVGNNPTIHHHQNQFPTKHSESSYIYSTITSTSPTITAETSPNYCTNPTNTDSPYHRNQQLYHVRNVGDDHFETVDLAEAIDRGFINPTSAYVIDPLSKDILNLREAIHRKIIRLEHPPSYQSSSPSPSSLSTSQKHSIRNVRSSVANTNTIFPSPISNQFSISQAIKAGILKIGNPKLHSSESDSMISKTESFSVKSVRDSRTNEFIAPNKAIKLKILDPYQGSYFDTASKRRYTIDEAISNGDILVEKIFDSSVAAKGEIPDSHVYSSDCRNIISTSLIREIRSFHLLGVIDPTTGSEVTVHQAISSGILDRNKGRLYNGLRDEWLSISEAINQGFIKARIMPIDESVDPRFLLGRRAVSETKTFALKGAVDTRTGMIISVRNAIEIGVIDQATGLYRNMSTKETMPISLAVEKGLILTEESGTYPSKRIEHGPTFITKNVRVLCIEAVVDPVSRKRLTVGEAFKHGLIDSANCSFLNTLTNKIISLTDAYMLGYIIGHYVDEEHTAGSLHKQSGELYARVTREERSYMITSVLDIRNDRRIDLNDAINRGLFDGEKAVYVNPLTKQETSLKDAIDQGFVQATVVSGYPNRKLPSSTRVVRIQESTNDKMSWASNKAYKIDTVEEYIEPIVGSIDQPQVHQSIMSESERHHIFHKETNVQERDILIETRYTDEKRTQTIEKEKGSRIEEIFIDDDKVNEPINIESETRSISLKQVTIEDDRTYPKGKVVVIDDDSGRTPVESICTHETVMDSFAHHSQSVHEELSDMRRSFGSIGIVDNKLAPTAPLKLEVTGVSSSMGAGVVNSPDKETEMAKKEREIFISEVLNKAKDYKHTREREERQEYENKSTFSRGETSKDIPIVRDDGICYSITWLLQPETNEKIDLRRGIDIGIFDTSSMHYIHTIQKKSYELSEAISLGYVGTDQDISAVVLMCDGIEYTIHWVLDPLEKSKIFPHHAIRKGILDVDNMRYLNPYNNVSINIHEAVKMKFIGASEKLPVSDEIDCMFDGHQIRFNWVVDSVNRDRVSAFDALKRGIIDMRKKIYLKIDTGDVLTLYDAYKAGYIGLHDGRNSFAPSTLSESLTSLDEDELTITTRTAIYVITSVVHPISQQEIKVSDAIELGILDKDTGSYRDMSTGIVFELPDAINDGLLYASVVETKESTEMETSSIRNVTERFIVNTVIDPRDGKRIGGLQAQAAGILNYAQGMYSDPDSGRWEAIDRSLIEVQLVTQTSDEQCRLDICIDSFTLRRVIIYTIYSVKDPVLDEDISAQEAVHRQIIDSDTKKYFNASTGQYLELRDAMSLGLLTADVSETIMRKPLRLSLQSAARLGFYSYSTGLFRDPFSEQTMTLQQAIDKGHIHLGSPAFASSNQGPISLRDALNMGIISRSTGRPDPTFLSQHKVTIADSKIYRMNFEDAIRCGLIDLSMGRYKHLHTGEKLSLKDAIGRSLLDGESTTFQHPLSGEFVSIAEALNSNLIDNNGKVIDSSTGCVISDIEQEFNQRRIFSNFDVNNGEVFLRSTGEKLSFSKALRKGNLDSHFKIVDFKSNMELSMQEAIEQGIVDNETGRIYNYVDGSSMSVREAIRRGFIAISGSTVVPMKADQGALVAQITSKRRRRSSRARSGGNTAPDRNMTSAGKSQANSHFTDFQCLNIRDTSDSNVYKDNIITNRINGDSKLTISSPIVEHQSTSQSSAGLNSADISGAGVNIQRADRHTIYCLGCDVSQSQFVPVYKCAYLIEAGGNIKIGRTIIQSVFDGTSCRRISAQQAVDMGLLDPVTGAYIDSNRSNLVMDYKNSIKRGLLDIIEDEEKSYCSMALLRKRIISVVDLATDEWVDLRTAIHRKLIKYMDGVYVMRGDLASNDTSNAKIEIEYDEAVNSELIKVEDCIINHFDRVQYQDLHKNNETIPYLNIPFGSLSDDFSLDEAADLFLDDRSSCKLCTYTAIKNGFLQKSEVEPSAMVQKKSSTVKKIKDSTSIFSQGSLTAKTYNGNFFKKIKLKIKNSNKTFAKLAESSRLEDLLYTIVADNQIVKFMQRVDPQSLLFQIPQSGQYSILKAIVKGYIFPYNVKLAKREGHRLRLDKKCIEIFRFTSRCKKIECDWLIDKRKLRIGDRTLDINDTESKRYIEVLSFQIPDYMFAVDVLTNVRLTSELFRKYFTIKDFALDKTLSAMELKNGQIIDIDNEKFLDSSTNQWLSLTESLERGVLCCEESYIGYEKPQSAYYVECEEIVIFFTECELFKILNDHFIQNVNEKAEQTEISISSSIEINDSCSNEQVVDISNSSPFLDGCSINGSQFNRFDERQIEKESETIRMNIDSYSDSVAAYELKLIQQSCPSLKCLKESIDFLSELSDAIEEKCSNFQNCVLEIRRNKCYDYLLTVKPNLLTTLERDVNNRFEKIQTEIYARMQLIRHVIKSYDRIQQLYENLCKRTDMSHNSISNHQQLCLRDIKKKQLEVMELQSFVQNSFVLLESMRENLKNIDSDLHAVYERAISFATNTGDFSETAIQSVPNIDQLTNIQQDTSKRLEINMNELNELSTLLAKVNDKHSKLITEAHILTLKFKNTFLEVEHIDFSSVNSEHAKESLSTLKGQFLSHSSSLEDIEISANALIRLLSSDTKIFRQSQVEEIKRTVDSLMYNYKRALSMLNTVDATFDIGIVHANEVSDSFEITSKSAQNEYVDVVQNLTEIADVLEFGRSKIEEILDNCGNASFNHGLQALAENSPFPILNQREEDNGRSIDEQLEHLQDIKTTIESNEFHDFGDKRVKCKYSALNMSENGRDRDSMIQQGSEFEQETRSVYDDEEKDVVALDTDSLVPPSHDCVNVSYVNQVEYDTINRSHVTLKFNLENEDLKNEESEHTKILLGDCDEKVTQMNEFHMETGGNGCYEQTNTVDQELTGIDMERDERKRVQGENSKSNKSPAYESSADIDVKLMANISANPTDADLVIQNCEVQELSKRDIDSMDEVSFKTVCVNECIDSNVAKTMTALSSNQYCDSDTCTEIYGEGNIIHLAFLKRILFEQDNQITDAEIQALLTGLERRTITSKPDYQCSQLLLNQINKQCAELRNIFMRKSVLMERWKNLKEKVNEEMNQLEEYADCNVNNINSVSDCEKELDQAQEKGDYYRNLSTDVNEVIFHSSLISDMEMEVKSTRNYIVQLIAKLNSNIHEKEIYSEYLSSSQQDDDYPKDMAEKLRHRYQTLKNKLDHRSEVVETLLNKIENFTIKSHEAWSLLSDCQSRIDELNVGDGLPCSLTQLNRLEDTLVELISYMNERDSSIIAATQGYDDFFATRDVTDLDAIEESKQMEQLVRKWKDLHDFIEDVLTDVRDHMISLNNLEDLCENLSEDLSTRMTLLQPLLLTTPDKNVLELSAQSVLDLQKTHKDKYPLITHLYSILEEVQARAGKYSIDELEKKCNNLCSDWIDLEGNLHDSIEQMKKMRGVVIEFERRLALIDKLVDEVDSIAKSVVDTEYEPSKMKNSEKSLLDAFLKITEAEELIKSCSEFATRFALTERSGKPAEDNHINNDELYHFVGALSERLESSKKMIDSMQMFVHNRNSELDYKSTTDLSGAINLCEWKDTAKPDSLINSCLNKYPQAFNEINILSADNDDDDEGADESNARELFLNVVNAIGKKRNMIDRLTFLNSQPFLQSCEQEETELLKNNLLSERLYKTNHVLRVINQASISKKSIVQRINELELSCQITLRAILSDRTIRYNVNNEISEDEIFSMTSPCLLGFVEKCVETIGNLSSEVRYELLLNNHILLNYALSKQDVSKNDWEICLEKIAADQNQCLYELATLSQYHASVPRFTEILNSKGIFLSNMLNHVRSRMLSGSEAGQNLYVISIDLNRIVEALEIEEKQLTSVQFEEATNGMFANKRQAFKQLSIEGAALKESIENRVCIQHNRKIEHIKALLDEATILHSDAMSAIEKWERVSSLKLHHLEFQLAALNAAGNSAQRLESLRKHIDKEMSMLESLACDRVKGMKITLFKLKTNDIPKRLADRITILKDSYYPFCKAFWCDLAKLEADLKEAQNDIYEITKNNEYDLVSNHESNIVSILERKHSSLLNRIEKLHTLTSLKELSLSQKKLVKLIEEDTEFCESECRDEIGYLCDGATEHYSCLLSETIRSSELLSTCLKESQVIYAEIESLFTWLTGASMTIINVITDDESKSLIEQLNQCYQVIDEAKVKNVAFRKIYERVHDMQGDLFWQELFEHVGADIVQFEKDSIRLVKELNMTTDQIENTLCARNAENILAKNLKEWLDTALDKTTTTGSDDVLYYTSAGLDTRRHCFEKLQDVVFFEEFQLRLLWEDLVRNVNNEKDHVELLKSDEDSVLFRLLTWMKAMEACLNLRSNEISMSGSFKILSKQYNQFMITYNEFSNHEADVDVKIRQTRKEIANDNNRDNRRLLLIENKWIFLKERITKIKQKFEDALDDASTFNKDLEILSVKLDDVEKKLNNLTSTNRSMEALLQQCKLHDEVLEDISLVRNQMVSIEKLGTKIRFNCRPSDAIMVRNLLFAIKRRYDRIISRSVEKRRVIDRVFREVERFEESNNNLTKWMNDVMCKLESDKTDLAEHKRLMREIEVNRLVFDQAIRQCNRWIACTSLSSERRRLKEICTNLKREWNRLVNLASQKRHDIEAMMLIRGEFEELSTNLIQWLNHLSASLSEMLPCYGDVLTVTALCESHDDLINDFDAVTQQIHLLTDQQNNKHCLPKEKITFIFELYLTAKNQVEKRSSSLDHALTTAIHFDEQMKQFLLWATKIENALLHLKRIPDVDDDLRVFTENLDQHLHDISDHQKTFADIKDMANAILLSCHPDAIKSIRDCVDLVETRINKIINCAVELEQMLSTLLTNRLARQKLLKELGDWLVKVETHLQGVEVICKEKLTLSTVEERLQQAELVTQDLKSISCKFESILVSNTNQSQAISSTICRFGTLYNVFESKSNSSAQMEYLTNRIHDVNCRKLFHRLHQSVQQSVSYISKLHEWLTFKCDNNELKQFDLERWIARNAPAINYCRSRLFNYFRQKDESQSGCVEVEDFIFGLISVAKLSTDRTQMLIVAELFKENVMVNYREFLALITNFEQQKNHKCKRRSVSGGDKKTIERIQREMHDEVGLCSCSEKYKMHPVSEGKYSFGTSNRVHLVRILRSTVMVRVGGGWVSLAEFLAKNDPCRGKGRTNLELREELLSNVGFETLNTPPSITKCTKNSTKNLQSTSALIRRATTNIRDDFDYSGRTPRSKIALGKRKPCEMRKYPAETTAMTVQYELNEQKIPRVSSSPNNIDNNDDDDDDAEQKLPEYQYSASKQVSASHLKSTLP